MLGRSMPGLRSKTIQCWATHKDLGNIATDFKGTSLRTSRSVRLGKRQVEELATLAAMDFEDFYETRRPARSKRGDLLVLSADGKGIVMRPDALRTGTARRGARGPQTEGAAVSRGSAPSQADGGDRRALRRDGRAAHPGGHLRLGGAGGV
jgi:hypothetical protein